MKLDLEKIWQICNILSEKQSYLSEIEDTYVQLLGNQSNYCDMSFKSFLDYYSFKVVEDEIVVYNDDKIAWEDYRTNDFSYLPVELLSFGEKQLNIWIENEIEMQLKQQEEAIIQEKENLKLEIERLTKKLNNHA